MPDPAAPSRPVSGGRTRLHPEERRRLILDEADRAFRRAEYSAVSLDDIARSAGVTRGLLHHYFGSKRSLYLAVIGRLAELASSVPLAPEGVQGDFGDVVDACVDRWLDVAAAAGGLWMGGASFELARSDVEDLVGSARDALVERMIDELPMPVDLERALLRNALRAFSAFASVATDDWLVHRTLDRPRTHALLSATLTALVEQVVPAMQRARPERG